MTTLLNFSHPITPEQRLQIEALLGEPLTGMVDVALQFDTQKPFEAQMKEVLAGLPLGEVAMQSEPLVVNLPSLNFIAALLLAELHGRMGYFPTILRLRPIRDAVPMRFEVAEILNLQAVREQARTRR